MSRYPLGQYRGRVGLNIEMVSKQVVQNSQGNVWPVRQALGAASASTQRSVSRSMFPPLSTMTTF